MKIAFIQANSADPDEMPQCLLESFKMNYISIHGDAFIQANSADPDEMPQNCGILSRSSLFPEVSA